MNNKDTRYVTTICFSDGSTCFLSCYIHRQNVRYSSDMNPQIFHGDYTLAFKINVWIITCWSIVFEAEFIRRDLHCNFAKHYYSSNEIVQNKSGRV